MKFLPRLLSTVAALVMAAGIAHAANIPFVTGAQDPSQINSTLNSLITSINAGTTGVLGVNTSAFSTSATSTEQTLQSIVIPANQLTLSGQSLKARCFGTFAANGNTKIVRLMLTSTTTAVGAVISSLSSSVQGSWSLELLATYAASATNTNWVGTGWAGKGGDILNSTATTLVSPVVATNTVINWTNAVTVSCAGVAATGEKDITASELLVEQVK